MQPAQRTKTTPPKLAQGWGVSVNKILAFIRSGELRAINVAPSDRHRPRYLIDLADVEAFENARQVVPEATPKPRRRKQSAVKDYF